MKKNLLFFVAAFLMTATYLNAQVMYTDDFESYTAGNGIAQEEGTWWNTWTGAPGTAEDPTVSDAYAYEGTQSVMVSGTNDGVIEFADLTEGRYRVEFYIMVPSGTLGYYNIMQNFNATVGSQNVWGMQVFLEDGTMSIDGAGEAAATYTYTPGEWFKVQHFIDLNSDWVDMYINDELVHAYQWSKGTFNDGTGVNKLDAFNFYAWDDSGAGTPEYYMDNFLIEEVETPYPATDFAYTVVNGNDVELTWVAPTEGTPESYSIVRDGIEIATTTELTYTDVNLYPNDYEYQLYAFYGTSSGYSASAGLLNVNIPGGNERELVVFEMFTSVNCGYCPYAAQAIDMLHDEGKDVAIIEYHGDGLGADPFTIDETVTRDAFYFALYPDDPPATSFGYPTTVFNGTGNQIGAITDVADQNSVYDYYYDEQLPIPSVYTIDSWIEPVSADPYLFNVHIDVEETFPYFDDDTRLMIALTETDIAYAWQTESELHFLAREMYPDGNGTVLDFSSETTYNTTVPVTIDPTWAVDNCEVVIFVQNFVTGHIQQAKSHQLYTFVNSEIEKNFETTVYPNPANSILNIFASENIDNVEVLNISGQLIDVVNVNAESAKLNVEKYSAGVYFVKVYTQNDVTTHKVIVE